MQRLLPIILIAAFASCATETSYEQVNVEKTVQLKSTADTLMNNHQFLAATDAYLGLIANDLRLLRDDDDLTDKRMLRARLELMAVQVRSIIASIGNSEYISTRFEELGISASDGGIYEHASILSKTKFERLGMLHNFEFVGPFDNERGIAFSAQLAAETDPSSEQTYSGKVRDVKWRTTPADVNPNGSLNMGQLLNPNRQSAIVMRTWVYSPNSQIAHALIGIDGELVAWCNGQAVLEALGRHDMTIHNFSTTLSLKAGWNELAFKLGSRDSSPKIVLRLVNDDDAYTPLLLEHRATAPAGVNPQILLAVNAEDDVAPQQIGALKFYSEIGDNYRSGLLKVAAADTPRSTHPGRAELAAAVAENPTDLNARFLYSKSLFPKGYESAEEIDLNPWLAQSQIISAQAPQHVGNLNLQLTASRNYQMLERRTLDLAKKIVELSNNSAHSLMYLAYTYQRLGYETQERDCWQQLLGNPATKKSPHVYQQALRNTLHHNSEEYIAAKKEHYAASNSPGTLKELIVIRRNHRSVFDGAIELAEANTLLETSPWNTNIHCEYAMRMLNAGEIQAATELLNRAELIKPENPTIWHNKARVALHTGDLETAVAHLERELELDYSDETEQRLLEMINSAAQEESFEEAYREDLAAIVARHPHELDGPDYSLETLLRRAVIKVSPDSTAKRYYRDVVRILNAEGVRRIARKGYGVRWGLQDLRILSAQILHSDGRTTDIPTGRGYSARVTEFPNLKVGDVIDVEYRIDDLRTSFFGTYFSLNHALSPLPSVPTRESLLTLISDPQLPLKLHTRNLGGVEAQLTTNDDGGETYDWIVHDIMPLKPEAFMPHASELTALVQASSYQSWSDFGDWWWNLIKDGISVSDEMASKVAELTDGLETKQQQLKAIYEFVTNEIRYNAWEFGVHGYQPYTAPVIFSRRFGDCKDKGILLRAMLSEVDIEALPVLIMRSATQQLGGRRPDEDLSLAMVEHFNHCIAYVPAQDGLEEQYMDGTANLTMLETLPFDDRGAQVVVIGPEGTTRKLIPFKDAAFNLEQQELNVQLNVDGSANLEYRNTPYGSYDSRVRSMFSTGAEQQQETMRRVASSLFGGFEGELELVLPLADDLAVTPIFGFDGKFSKWATINDDTLELDASPFHDNLFKRYTSLTERETDIVMQHASTKRRRYNVQLPAGYTVEELADVSISNTTGSYSWHMSVTANELTIEETIVINKPRVAVADYAQFRELCRTIDDAQNLSIRITEAN